MKPEIFEMLGQDEVVNVASVPFRSPFRYPGGKTWLVPRIRQWFASMTAHPKEFVEPFAGGSIVGLTVAFEALAPSVTIVELDSDIASVWSTILSDRAHWLADRILAFDLTIESVSAVLEESNRSTAMRAFATIIRNRISRGGILAAGAGIVRNGENGRGLSSRWYPTTLSRRILDIAAIRDRIHFEHGDGIKVLRRYKTDPGVVFFVDPPYTIAGRRLYTHSEIDHKMLFQTVNELRGDFLMTYDDAPDVRDLACTFDFEIRLIPMKSTHHEVKSELLIGRNLQWLDT